MKSILLIFPHQLFDPKIHKNIFASVDEIHMIEDTLFFGDPHVQIPFHTAKLVLHRASMQAYHDLLIQSFPHKKINYHQYNNETIESHIKNIGLDHTFTIIDPTDYLLKKRIRRILPGIEFIESPLFLNTKKDNADFCKDKKSYLMHSFYIHQRKRLDILMESDGTPNGGQWSFDHDNRKKIPKKHYTEIPAEPTISENPYVIDAKKWVTEHFPNNPSSPDIFWYPVTHEEARAWFKEFLKERLALFGDYEDAITRDHHILYHSVLSPLLNIGLLDVRYVVEQSLAYASNHDIPLNSLEGFIRQIIGWREYVRLQYELHGTQMRKSNYWNHARVLSKNFWDGTTGLDPLDNAVEKITKTGYLHHIERLMIAGNAFFLLEIHPDSVYEWFMSLSIDSFDWVMVPNVYGMSQHAAGNLMTTKPYMSGSNYIRKMSDYGKDDWCEIWDALYWHFMIKHHEKLSKNHRMGMIASRVLSFSNEKKKEYSTVFKTFCKSLWGK